MPASKNAKHANAKAGVPAGGRLPHDQLHKSYFAKVAAVRDLFVVLVTHILKGADEWLERIDFDTLAPMPTETIDEAFRSRFNDMVWRVRFRDPAGEGAEWMYIIVMLEFQSTVDWFMALRIQSYAVRIYESLPVSNRPNSESRLPPILSIVVYNGRSPWGAAKRLSELVGSDTRPVEPSLALAPTYTGESYVLLDLPQLALEALPPDNVVSLLARAHGIREVGDVAPIVDEGLRLLRGPQREELDDVFFRWFAQLGARLGVDLTFLEDKQMRDQLRGGGEVRLMVEERLQAQLDQMKAASLEKGLERGREEGREEGLEEGLEKGLDRERNLLRRLTAWRFGTDTARHLGALLADIKDSERLSSVGDWILDCATGPELLDRLQNAD